MCFLGDDGLLLFLKLWFVLCDWLFESFEVGFFFDLLKILVFFCLDNDLDWWVIDVEGLDWDIDIEVEYLCGERFWWGWVCWVVDLGEWMVDELEYEEVWWERWWEEEDEGMCFDGGDWYWDCCGGDVCYDC